MARRRKKQQTGLFLSCPCGARAPVFQIGQSKWFAHCVGCGRLTFWSNPSLTERLRFGGDLCPHNPAEVSCRNNGLTSWCPICRIRTFKYPEEAKFVQS